MYYSVGFGYNLSILVSVAYFWKDKALINLSHSYSSWFSSYSNSAWASPLYNSHFVLVSIWFFELFSCVIYYFLSFFAFFKLGNYYFVHISVGNLTFALIWPLLLLLRFQHQSIACALYSGERLPVFIPIYWLCFFRRVLLSPDLL